MTDKKIKYGFWLPPEVNEQIDRHIPMDCCSANRSEFVENAILFYVAHLSMESTMALLPAALSTTIEGIADSYFARLSSLLYKMLVDQNITNHLLAADSDMSTADYQQLRGQSIREINSTHGRINLKDAIQFQKTV